MTGAPRHIHTAAKLRLVPADPIEVQAVETNRGVAPTEIGTDRLIIRPWLDEDEGPATELISANRAHLMRWFPLNEPRESDRMYVARQIRRSREGDADGSCFRRLITLRGSGEPIGAINLNRITRGLEWSADANWWIAARHTRRGLAFETVSAVLRFAMVDQPSGLGLHVIHAGVCPDNEPGMALVQKLGFVIEPKLASHLHINGAWLRHETLILRAC